MVVDVANNSHDAVSRLLQLHARRAGLSLKWTGRTTEDMESVMTDLAHKTQLCQCLWGGMRELWEMPEMKLLSEKYEPIYAKICGTILKAQANFELKRAGSSARPPKAPPGGGLA